METAEQQAAFSLRISRTINAPREKVFQAWLDEQALANWFAPSSEHRTTVHELDARVGGNYRITMHAPDGENHTVVGQYLRIAEPTQLMFSWNWEHMDDAAESIVTINFIEHGETTELVLEHERLPDQPITDLHNQGWEGCLGRLQELFD